MSRQEQSPPGQGVAGLGLMFPGAQGFMSFLDPATQTEPPPTVVHLGSKLPEKQDSTSSPSPALSSSSSLSLASLPSSSSLSSSMSISLPTTPSTPSTQSLIRPLQKISKLIGQKRKLYHDLLRVEKKMTSSLTSIKNHLKRPELGDGIADVLKEQEKQAGLLGSSEDWLEIKNRIDKMVKSSGTISFDFERSIADLEVILYQIETAYRGKSSYLTRSNSRKSRSSPKRNNNPTSPTPYSSSPSVPTPSTPTTPSSGDDFYNSPDEEFRTFEALLLDHLKPTSPSPSPSMTSTPRSPPYPSPSTSLTPPSSPSPSPPSSSSSPSLSPPHLTSTTTIKYPLPLYHPPSPSPSSQSPSSPSSSSAPSNSISNPPSSPASLSGRPASSTFTSPSPNKSPPSSSLPVSPLSLSAASVPPSSSPPPLSLPSTPPFPSNTSPCPSPTPTSPKQRRGSMGRQASQKMIKDNQVMKNSLKNKMKKSKSSILRKEFSAGSKTPRGRAASTARTLYDEIEEISFENLLEVAALGTSSSTFIINLAGVGKKGGGEGEGDGRKVVFGGEEGRGMMNCFLSCFGLLEEGKGGAERIVGRLLSFVPTLTQNESVKLFFFLSKWLELHFDTLAPPPPSLDSLFKELQRFPLGDAIQQLYLTQKEHYESIINQLNSQSFSLPAPHQLQGVNELCLALTRHEESKYRSLNRSDLLHFKKKSNLYQKYFLNLGIGGEEGGEEEGEVGEEGEGLDGLFALSLRITNWIEKLITCTELNSNSENSAFEDILMDEKVKKFKWAISFAETLLEIQNFSSCMSVIAGIQHTNVHKDPKITKLLDRKLLRRFEKIQKLMSPHLDFVTYRSYLEGARPPSLPCIGILLIDLEQISPPSTSSLSSSSSFSPSSLIDFGEWKKIYPLVSNFYFQLSQSYIHTTSNKEKPKPPSLRRTLSNTSSKSVTSVTNSPKTPRLSFRDKRVPSMREKGGKTRGSVRFGGSKEESGGAEEDDVIPFFGSADITKITLQILLETIIKEKEQEGEGGAGWGKGKVGFGGKGRGDGKGRVKEAFFFTFRKYTSVGEVMECFLTILKENNNKSKIVLDILRDWVKDNSSALEEDKAVSLLNELKKYHSSEVDDLQQLMKTTSHDHENSSPNTNSDFLDFTPPSSSPLSSPSLSAVERIDLQWKNFSPPSVAEALTCYEFSIFRKINTDEFLSWNTKNREKCENILAVCAFSTKISSWVTTQIVLRAKLVDRVYLFEKFILLAEILLELKNFSGCMSVLGGLGNTAIYRMKKTRKEVDSEFIQKHEKMSNLMSHRSSFANYRAHLKSVTPPCLPFLGVSLSDLTFMEDGNKNSEKGFINMQKWMMIARVIKDLKYFQQNGWDEAKECEFEKAFTEVSCFDNSKCDKYSKIVENNDPEQAIETILDMYEKSKKENQNEYIL